MIGAGCVAKRAAVGVRHWGHLPPQVLAGAVADLLMGKVRNEAWHQAYRALEYASARKRLPEQERCANPRRPRRTDLRRAVSTAYLRHVPLSGEAISPSEKEK